LDVDNLIQKGKGLLGDLSPEALKELE